MPTVPPSTPSPLRFSEETLVTASGRPVRLPVVRHPGGAAIIALWEGKVCLLRQYRPVMGEWIVELPAGKLEPGESPQQTAKRELAEETGLYAKRWREIGHIVPSPGYCDEVLYLYVADVVSGAPGRPEPNQDMEIKWVLLESAVADARNGKIKDAKTALALLRIADSLDGAVAAQG